MFRSFAGSPGTTISTADNAAIGTCFYPKYVETHIDTFASFHVTSAWLTTWPSWFQLNLVSLHTHGSELKCQILVPYALQLSFSFVATIQNYKRTEFFSLTQLVKSWVLLETEGSF